MTQTINSLTELDAAISALETQLSTLNFEYLTAMNSADGTAGGKTAVEIAAGIFDAVKGILADRQRAEHRRGLIQQLVTAAFAPVEFSERELQLKTVADRARQLALEAANVEQQARAIRTRAESTRGRTIDALRADGLTDADLNKINTEIQRAKNK